MEPSNPGMGVFLAHGRSAGAAPGRPGREPEGLRRSAIMARARSASNGPDFIPRPTRIPRPIPRTAFAAPSATAVPSSFTRPSSFAGPSLPGPSLPSPSLAGQSFAVPSAFAPASFMASDPFFDAPGSSRRPSGLFPDNPGPPSRPPARNDLRQRAQFVAGPSVPAMASSAVLVRPEVWGASRRSRDQFEEDNAIVSDDDEEAKVADERREQHRQRFMHRPPTAPTDSSILTVHEPSWAVRPTNARISTTIGYSPRTTPAGSLVSTQPCDWDEADDADTEAGFGNTTIPQARSYIPTPGSEVNFGARTQAQTTTATSDQDHFVCAISESRSGDVIGVAVVNITTGQANITRILNDDKYQRLVDTLSIIEHPPQCFLVLKSVSDKASKSLLVPCLEVEFPNVPMVPIARAHWNESEGLAIVETLALRSQVKALRACLENNFYVSCAFCAALTYIREELNLAFGHHSMRITYSQPSESMVLDRVTITSLELLENIRPTKFKGSTLFGILNSTRTPQGRRLLRSSLLQPSTNEKKITDRYDAVEELVGNEDLFIELGKCLKGLLHIDIERIAMWIDFTTRQPRVPLEDQLVLAEGRHHLAPPSHQDLQSAEQELNNMLMLKQFLAGASAIHEALASAECTSTICSWIRHECSNESTAEIKALIEGYIEKDAVYSKAPVDVRNNRLWAIKSQCNGILEEARKLFRDHTDDLNSYFDSLNQQFSTHLGNEAGLHLDSNRHYYLKFQWSDVEREILKNQTASGTSEGGLRQLPLAGVAIVNGIRKKNIYQCQTVELIQKSRNIQLQADIVTMQSDKMVIELKKSLSQHAGALLELGEAIATLDMLCSFVQLSTTQNYVRPTISDTLVLQQARHAIMDARKASFIPNDCYSGNDLHRLQVVTGSNMSGKSTYIKSIALIQILAQMGCFVPAQHASISICDRLFTRLSTEDKPESNLGTFAVEMREMNLILRQATKNSMVIIDELGRGTSPKDGLYIALSMCEKLIDLGSRVFFATHFTKLARILNNSRANGVLNIHLTAESTTDGETRQITLPHTVTSGPVKNEDYGLDLASRFFPPRIVRNAEKISHFLRGVDAEKKPGPETQTYKQNRLVMALPEILQQAHDSSMDDATLASYLNRLCIEFTTRMDQIDQEDDADLDVAEDEVMTEPPQLDKPDPLELATLMQRFEAEEERVMKNNVPRQPSTFAGPGRIDATSGEESIAGTPIESSPTLPLPINRTRLIRDQTAQAGTTNTSASFSVGGADDDDDEDEPMWTSSPSGF